MAQDDNTAHLAALTLLIQDLVEITHQLAPDLVEDKLRAARLLFQEAEAGRVEDQDDQTLLAHRLRRDLLERGVARSRQLDD